MSNAKRSLASSIVSILVFSFAVIAIGAWYSYFVSSRKILAHMAPGNVILPVSITVYGRGNDTISARLAFYSSDWTIINTLERSWPGWEISIDSCIIESGAGWIVLPLVIRTDETREGQGVEVSRYYDRDGFPSIYESVRITPRERKALVRLFSLAKSGFPAIFASGRFSRRTTTLRQFESGTEYFLHVDESGTLSFR